MRWWGLALRQSRHFSSLVQRVSRRNRPAPIVYVETGLKIATIGRPNVGKSTLFNALASAVRGRRTERASSEHAEVFIRSVVDPSPGITRDARSAAGAIADLRFTITDTPGLEEALSPQSAELISRQGSAKDYDDDIVASEDDSVVSAVAMTEDRFYRALYKRMVGAAADAVRDADVALLVLDASEGVTPIDRGIAQWLRSMMGRNDGSRLRRVLVLANKFDKAGAEAGAADACALGLGDAIATSGEQRLGFGNLYNAVYEVYKEKELESPSNLQAKRSDIQVEPEEENYFDDELVVAAGPPKGEEPLTQLIVSIVGRPNVGKSTLMNRMLGSTRALVGPAAGVTRDTQLAEWIPERILSDGKEIAIWVADTAGIRHPSRIKDGRIEQLCVRSTLRAMHQSHVVLLVIDAAAGITTQDTKLADIAITHGRGIVLVANKMDTIPKETLKEFRKTLRQQANDKMWGLAGMEIVETAIGKTDDLERLHAAVCKTRKRWETRVTTSSLNRFMQRFNERMFLAGSVKGARRNRNAVAKFASQKRIRPPMFRIDGAAAVSQAYLKSLTNAIRLEFGFRGVPIRVKRPSRRG